RRLAAAMVAMESTGISARNFLFTIMSNWTARLGSGELVSFSWSRYPTRIPLRRTGVPLAMPEASSMKVYSTSFCWKMPLELVRRNTRTKTMTNAVSASPPTFNCDQRTFARSAIILFPLLHELANVRIRRRFQPVLVALEDQPAFAQDHENGPCI